MSSRALLAPVAAVLTAVLAATMATGAVVWVIPGLVLLGMVGLAAISEASLEPSTSTGSVQR